MKSRDSVSACNISQQKKLQNQRRKMCLVKFLSPSSLKQTQKKRGIFLSSNTLGILLLKCYIRQIEVTVCCPCYPSKEYIHTGERVTLFEGFFLELLREMEEFLVYGFCGAFSPSL